MHPLLEAIDALMGVTAPLVAIDGPCAGGKSTLAKRLKELYPEAAVYHMDDFFLQPSMRTPQRLAEPGGNVDRERFLREVLIPLSQGVPFTYHVYDCQRDSLTPVEANPAPLSIIEGAYSLHPDLRDHYDLKVFLDVPPDEQIKRILVRNGERMAQRFFREWIPMENAYFEAFAVRGASDLMLGSGE